MKLQSFILLIFIATFYIQCKTVNYRTENISPPNNKMEVKINNLYETSQLAPFLPYELFRTAMIGFYNIDNRTKKSDKIIIIDYSKNSTVERCFIIDINEGKLLHKFLIAHGRNSGEDLATSFSNIENSKQSSLGFYLTAETYIGKHGYSIRLDGIEKGINHNARQRAIVVHRADYVSHDFIKENGRLGRSWGCPALPSDVSDDIIKSISCGRCMFIYGKNADYANDSKFMLKGS